MFGGVCPAMWRMRLWDERHLCWHTNLHCTGGEAGKGLASRIAGRSSAPFLKLKVKNGGNIGGAGGQNTKLGGQRCTTMLRFELSR